MQPGQPPTAAKIIGELLASHPEAASLLAHASHCRALAVCSAITAKLRFAAAQTARLSYEELRHRLEPRSRYRVHFGVGLLLVFVLSAGLAMLNLIELSDLLGRPGSVLPALAATAAWVTVAWLGAVAVCRRRWPAVASIAAAAVALGMLLVALHGLGTYPDWPTAGGHSAGSMVFGALTGTFILVLTVGVGAVVAYTESASLLPARRRWHRARAAHEEAVETERADMEAAAVAAEAWLGLVRTQVTGIAADDERLVQATMTLAAVLVESSRPQLAPPRDRHQTTADVTSL